MKIKLGGLAAIIGATVLFLALPALGQVPVTVTFNGPGAGDGVATLTDSQRTDTAYTGIYNATISGLGANTSAVVCDDLNDNINLGQTWNASGIRIQDLNASNIDGTEFGATIGVAGYVEVAQLVALLSYGGTTLGNISGITASDISEAIWAVTTPGGITSGLSSNAIKLAAWVTNVYGPMANDPQELYEWQLAFGSIFVLTPSPNGGGQELLVQTADSAVQVPEGGAALLYLLLAGAACFGAMKSGFRGRVEVSS
jgi:hypothetical protein